MTKRLTNRELAQKIQEQEQLIEGFEKQIQEFETNLDLLKGSLKESQERVTTLINENVYLKGKLETEEGFKKETEEAWRSESKKRYELQDELDVLKSKWYVKLFS